MRPSIKIQHDTKLRSREKTTLYKIFSRKYDFYKEEQETSTLLLENS